MTVRKISKLTDATIQNYSKLSKSRHDDEKRHLHESEATWNSRHTVQDDYELRWRCDSAN